MKTYLVVASLVVMLMMGGALGALSLSTSYEVSPESVNPGGSVQVIVQVTNQDFLIDMTELEIELFSRKAGITVTTPKADLGTVATGSTSSAAFTVRVASSISPGTYSLEAIGRYEYTGSAGEDTTFRLNIPLVVAYRSNLEIYAPDTQVTPGASEDLLVTINNAGKSDIHDVIVSITSSDTFVYPVGNVRDSIGGIAVGESSEASFQIRASDSATVGIHPITISVEYTDSAGVTQTDTQSMGINVVDAGTEIVIDSIESNLEPGKTETVKIGLRKVGGVDLENLYCSISTEADAEGNHMLSISGSNEKLLDSLGEGKVEYVEFEFDVDPDSEARPVGATLDITYQREGGKKQMSDSKPLGIAVMGYVELRVIEVKANADDGEIEVDIANYGNKDADAVKIEVLSGGEVFGTGFTDKIKPNKHKVFRFDLPAEQAVTVRMTYKDYEAEGGELEVLETITLDKDEIMPSDEFPVASVIIGMLILGAILWYVFRRKKNDVKIDVEKYREKTK